ncbi:hypothetical protein OH76DRAFT_1247243 [Lentinus brumalis]|uniref:Uncharacterized protein n=1 Tax=Lentinus brumalis TaxID=2498619 RepID=A0A371CRV3_9APHY|nr:hypothetical protein OH76DRAFT_1247243 [Polyporus brumalis]
MNDPDHEPHKVGHNGFPVVLKPDGEHAYGHGYMDEPAPPRYDEASVYDGSESSYTGSNSSYTTTTSRTSPPASQLSSPAPYGSGPARSRSVPHSTERAIPPNYSSAHERPHGSYRDFLPPPGPPQAAAPYPQSPASTDPFTRVLPRHLTYGPFPPAVLHAHSDDLVRGFPLEPPTCLGASQPHPFIDHDVNEDDWARFLHDVRVAGGQGPVNSAGAGATAPWGARRGLVGMIVDMAMSSNKKSPVADVIADWNNRFFHPRLMNVVLAQGAVTYTGPEDVIPPDMEWRSQNGMRDGGYVRAYDDTRFNDRFSDPYGPRGRFSSRWDRWDGGVGADRMGRRGLMGGVGGLRELRLAGLGADRGERVGYSRDLRASAGEKWRLIVTYNPPTP